MLQAPSGRSTPSLLPALTSGHPSSSHSSPFATGASGGRTSGLARPSSRLARMKGSDLSRSTDNLDADDEGTPERKAVRYMHSRTFVCSFVRLFRALWLSACMRAYIRTYLQPCLHHAFKPVPKLLGIDV